MKEGLRNRLVPEVKKKPSFRLKGVGVRDFHVKIEDDVDVDRRKIKTSFSADAGSKIPELEQEMNNLKYENEEPVYVHAKKAKDARDFKIESGVQGSEPQTEHSSTQEKKEDYHGFDDVKTFDYLFQVLDGMEGISGSGQYFTADELKEIIQDVRERKIDVIQVTKSAGLQDCVIRLLASEHMDSGEGQQEKNVVSDNTTQEGTILNSEEDVIVRGFDKEAFEFPERYDAVWDRFAATHPEKAVLYREQNPGIRSALERKEAVGVAVPKNEFKPEQKFFDLRFEKEFHITKEQLSQIEGFERLSEGQQKLVFENFTQLALGRVQEESARLSAEYTVNRREEMEGRFGELLGKVFSGVREMFTKGYSDLKREQQVAEEMRTGGFDVHRNLLEQLIQGMNTRGPRVHENENGELVVDLVNIRDRARGELRGPEYEAMTELNKVAHEFAKIPAEWRAQTLGVDTGEEWGITTFFKEKILKTKEKVHAQTYKEKEIQYTNAKKQLELILRQSGKNDLEIAETLLGIDSRVTQLQAIQTNPDAIAELEKIKDKNFWVESAKKLVSGPGIYMGLGFAGRTFLGAGLGILAAPITSAGVAYIRSWNKTAAELRERDRNARGGVRDVGEGALNIVSAEALIQKTRYLIERYRNESDPKKKAKFLAQLRVRTEYIRDKQMLHRVDYGSREHVVTNQTGLSSVFGEAFAVLADEEFTSNKTAGYRFGEVQNRLNRQLKNTENRIITTRRINRAVEQHTSAGKAVFFSIAGVAIADHVAGYLNGPSQGATVAGGVSGGTASSVEGVGTLAKGYGQEGVPYTIKAGDTLTEILKEQAPSIKDLGHTHAQENAVANILRSLTPVEMDSIGLGSHNIDDIKVDDSIDVEKLNAIIAEKHSIIESAQNRFGDEPVRSYTEVSPKSGSQQIEISKDIDAPGASPKPDEVMNRDQGGEASSSEGRSASDIVLEQQAEDSSLRSEEEAPRAEAQQKSPAPSEPIIQPASPPEKIIEIEDAPVKRIEANDHVPSKFPEEGVRIPKGLEGSDSVADGQAEGGLVKSNASTPESTFPDYVEDGGTALDTESNAPEAKSTPGVHSPQETFKNTYGTEIDPKKEDIYELTGRGGEKVMVSYGGKNFETRFDFAQEYVKKNPDAAVIVEEEPRYGAFGQKLPPSYVEVRYVRGEGVTTIFSIQDDTLPASSEKGIDPATFTKKVTK